MMASIIYHFSEQMWFCDTRQDLGYDCLHCFFNLYENRVLVYTIIIYSTGFAGSLLQAYPN